MSPGASSRAVIAALCALLAVAAATNNHGQCKNYGARCEGAPGKPRVQGSGCCQGYACTMKKAGEWGKFCQGIEPHEPVTGGASDQGGGGGGGEAQCKTYGQTCKGPPGKTAVPWGKGCCQGYSCSKRAADGSVQCQGIEPHEPVTGGGGGESGGQIRCKVYGETCKGAPGKAPVPWGKGCCQGYSCNKYVADGSVQCQGIEPHEPVTMG